MKPFALLLVGLALGVGLMWWWVGGRPRTLAQPSDSLAGWIQVTGTESIPVASGGKTWIVGSEIRLRNITGHGVRVAIPAQRFVVVLRDGSTVVGRLAEAGALNVASQQTATLTLPKVSFFSDSETITGVVLVIDEGDGLRPIIAPVGEEPPAPKVEPDKPAPAK